MHVMVRVGVTNQLNKPDEIITEVDESRKDSIVPRIERLMVEAANEIMPGMLIKAEPALMRRWTKNAEPVFDREGKLIAWEDAPFDEDGNVVEWYKVPADWQVGQVIKKSVA